MVSGDVIELKSQRAAIELPANALEVRLEIKTYEDGKIINVQRTLGIEEVRDAFFTAKECYIFDDDVFVINQNYGGVHEG